jgi:hypothetical protein
MLAIDLITRAHRKEGAANADIALEPNQATDGLAALNVRLHGFLDFVGRRLIPYPGAVTSALTMQAGYRYRANTSSAALNLTFPLNASDGQAVGVVDARNSFDSHALGLLPNGHKLEGVAATKLLETQGDNREWFYRDDTGDWVLIQSVGLEDEVYFPDGICELIAVLIADDIAQEYGQERPPADKVKVATDTIVRRYGKRGRAQADPPISIQTPAAPRRTMQA